MPTEISLKLNATIVAKRIALSTAKSSPSGNLIRYSALADSLEQIQPRLNQLLKGKIDIFSLDALANMADIKAEGQRLRKSS